MMACCAVDPAWGIARSSARPPKTDASQCAQGGILAHGGPVYAAEPHTVIVELEGEIESSVGECADRYRGLAGAIAVQSRVVQVDMRIIPCF